MGTNFIFIFTITYIFMSITNQVLGFSHLLALCFALTCALYFALSDNPIKSGPDAGIWKQRVDPNLCPYDQPGVFGWWNGKLDVADDTQVWMKPVRKVFIIMLGSRFLIGSK